MPSLPWHELILWIYKVHNVQQWLQLHEQWNNILSGGGGGGSLFPSNLQNWMTVFASHTPRSILSNTLKWLSFLFCSFETSIVTFIYFSLLLGHAYMRTCAFFKFALYIHMHVILWVCALWCTSVCFIMFCMNLWLLMFLIIILYYYWFVCVYLCVSGFSSSCKELWVPKSTQYIPY